MEYPVFFMVIYPVWNPMLLKQRFYMPAFLSVFHTMSYSFQI